MPITKGGKYGESFTVFTTLGLLSACVIAPSQFDLLIKSPVIKALVFIIFRLRFLLAAFFAKACHLLDKYNKILLFVFQLSVNYPKQRPCQAPQFAA